MGAPAAPHRPLAGARRGADDAIVRVGERPDDLSYERTCARQADLHGIAVRRFVLPTEATQAELEAVIDAVNAEDRFKLSVRDECGVQQDAAVIELLILGKEEAQRSVPESTIFIPQAANTSENSAAPSMKSSISVTSSRNT